MAPEPVAIAPGSRPASAGMGCASGALVIGNASTCAGSVGELSRKQPAIDAIHAHQNQYSARPKRVNDEDTVHSIRSPFANWRKLSAIRTTDARGFSENAVTS
jgi:hypothetical protein